MTCHAFTHAILRTPGRSVVDGLRAHGGAGPDHDALLAEHAAYAQALRDLGLTLDILDPLEDFPDSVFVEDPALVFTEGAILMRPGAASRQGEVALIRPALDRHFARVIALAEGLADGGDVMVTPDKVLIGYIQAARKFHDAGLSVQPKPKPKPALPVPADLAAALKRSKKAAAAWADFSPSCRREYIEWITEAKRPETRETRVLTTLEWVAEGKKRNWKYENC